MSDVGNIGIGVLVVIFFSYFLPAIVAAIRKKTNANAIFILNLFLGWTLLGWVIALIWAVKTDQMDIINKKNR